MVAQQGPGDALVALVAPEQGLGGIGEAGAGQVRPDPRRAGEAPGQAVAFRVCGWVRRVGHAGHI